LWNFLGIAGTNICGISFDRTDFQKSGTNFFSFKMSSTQTSDKGARPSNTDRDSDAPSPVANQDGEAAAEPPILQVLGYAWMHPTDNPIVTSQIRLYGHTALAPDVKSPSQPRWSGDYWTYTAWPTSMQEAYAKFRENNPLPTHHWFDGDGEGVMDLQEIKRAKPVRGKGEGKKAFGETVIHNTQLTICTQISSITQCPFIIIRFYLILPTFIYLIHVCLPYPCS
jgi:hypothetical protein